MFWAVVPTLLAGVAMPAGAAEMVANPALGLRVMSGFEVSLYADNALANDIYAMTLDPDGQVVVTGPGYVRTLLDTNADGVADAFRPFATTETGGMGLCFDGSDLLFCGDGYLSRYYDQNGDGVADGAPERLLPIDWSEWGGHGIRKGPDGWWYLMAGSETHFTERHVSLPTALIRNPEGGALLELSPDMKNAGVFAEGFANPYDFAFNWLGDIFTWDSDVAGDVFLPWYTPTRLYQVEQNGHHGWRLAGERRSWNRPPYYVDTTEAIAPMGRAAPTGMLCYRHFQFPAPFRGGLFGLDWAFGRIWFFSLQAQGAGYQAAPELFLEAIPPQGFAPTDAVVAPDGSLLVSIGGHKTRGGVYRIHYVAEPALTLFATNWANSATSDLELVLRAPQPMSAWSRASWAPRALRLGPQTFNRAVLDPRLPVEWRVRAVEVVTELLGGLPPQVANLAMAANQPAVRARVAWSVGRVPPVNVVAVLSTLANDPVPVVRRFALASMEGRPSAFSLAAMQQVLAANLGHADPQIRRAAARLAVALPEAAFQALLVKLKKGKDPQATLTALLALIWRHPERQLHGGAVSDVLPVLQKTDDPQLRLQAVRLIILGLGDYKLHKAAQEVYTGYDAAAPLDGHEELLSAIAQALHAIFPSGETLLDVEIARLCAMLSDDDADLPAKVMAKCTDTSTAASDFHYLTVYSRLAGPHPAALTPKVAQTILRLDRKLGGQERRPGQNWDARLMEVAQQLLKQDDQLADALVSDPGLETPGNLPLVNLLGPSRYLACARLFFEAARNDSTFDWSPDLVELLSNLPAEEVTPLFRQKWSRVDLRDAVLLQLANEPVALDRERFVEGLTSPQEDVQRACLSALLKLPVDPSRQTLVEAFRVLRRSLGDPKRQVIRAQVVQLINVQSGQHFSVQETAPDQASLAQAYQPLFVWLATQHPALFRSLDGSNAADPASWNALLRTVRWGAGNALQGAQIFQQRCADCHGVRAALGPDLRGIAQRLPPYELFHEILFPDRHVAEPYRLTEFRLRTGQLYAGMVAFESPDLVLLQTGAGTTERLPTADIATRRQTLLSLMPPGLLTGLGPADLANLYAYLRSLQTGR